MSFSSEWNTIYNKNLQMSSWPWSDLISYYFRYVHKKILPQKVLELGCGAGANIRFFNEMGIPYYGIDGSITSVKYLQNKFPEIKKKIICGDFTKSLGFDNKFDIIFDRASVTHNTTASIVNVLNLVYESLTPQGFFIGIDWFSKEHSDFSIVKSEFVDYNTRCNFVEGQFKDVGNVHFSNTDHIKFLFQNFKILVLEEKKIENKLNKEPKCFSSFNLVCTKS